MKKIISPIILFLLIFAVYFLSIKVITSYKLKENSVSTNDASNKTKDNLRISFYENYNSFITENENIQITDIPVSDTSFVYKNISWHIGKKPVLVIRYSDLDCFDCVRTIVSLVDKNYKDQLERIILLTNHNTEKDFKLKYDRLKTDIKIISNRENDSLTSLDNKGFPYMFVVDPSLKIHHVYIPFKEFPDHINSYMETVLSKLTKS